MITEMDARTSVDLQAIFQAQQNNRWKIAKTTTAERKRKLAKLRVAIETTYRKAIQEALQADLHRSNAETDLSEIYPVISEVKHTMAYLSRWMRDAKVDTPLALLGSTSYIKYEPKGVCLIISPWNFPINLTFGPLISAIAAGNTVIIKPSEMTPHTSAIMRTIIADLFTADEVCLVEGGVETSTALLALPFNHIFFTGAPSIGKIVMKAAANHLASVTLELGGKSPTIVDASANLKDAAQMIAWGKFSNSGQICIAPDYIFVENSVKDAFVQELIAVIDRFYGRDAASSNDFTRIVNEQHTKRVVGYLEDTIAHGAKLLYGGKCNLQQKYLQPTILTDVAMDAAVMTNEIFGPILPIIGFDQIEEVYQHINANEKPLALYIFSKSNRNIRTILDNTSAGGTCINNVAVHFYNNNLPFGGINNSGLGKAHGIFGFEAFSNARAVYRQWLPSALKLMMPPYSSFKERLINLVIKYL